MKMKGQLPIRRKTITILIVSVAGLALLWCIFYLLIVNMIRFNMKKQAMVATEALISRIEDEVVVLDDTAYSLSYCDVLKDMTSESELKRFYDMGAKALEDVDVLLGNQTIINNVAVYKTDGHYYRLKGRMSNTALEKTYDRIASGDKKTLSLVSDGISYLGTVKPVITGNIIMGYVVILMEQSEFEKIFLDFKDMEYLGIVLTNDDTILCANRDIQLEDLDDIRDTGFFVREKAIGLTGCKLMIYREYDVSRNVSLYFGVALMITIFLFILIIFFFMRHLNRDYVQLRIRDMEIERERNILLLLKKQISAHFTVNTLNVVRALIRRGDKETAGDTCDGLSFLLRYANAGEGYISLLEEFHCLDRYVKIMQTRYPGRFEFVAESEEEWEEERIPRMLLQPIVENAILHGFIEASGTITIMTECVEDIVIRVRDDGCGMEKEVIGQIVEKFDNGYVADMKLKGMALINIHKRIRMLYGEEYGLSIQSEKGKGTVVTLKLGKLPN